MNPTPNLAPPACSLAPVCSRRIGLRRLLPRLGVSWPAGPPALAVLAMVAVGLSGCLSFDDDMHDDCWRDVEGPGTQTAGPAAPTPSGFGANPRTAYADMGFDARHWPDLHGARITILDHGAFNDAFEEAKPLFEALTNATVVQHAAQDAGTALELVVQDLATGGHSFDILYGIDNALMSRAVAEGVFEPYTPLLAVDIEPAYRFVPRIDGAWAATPVDVGFIGINVDARADPVAGLGDLVARADEFVTQDPRTSSPGLGFLIATVATYGPDCYLGYWEDLFENDVTITSGWTEAYANRFSGGYGQYEDGTRLDRSIVTSYTTSPAYEMYYGSQQRNQALTVPESTFQQIQTMGIVKGTSERAAAEAWIEFTLTPAFQNLAAPHNAIYPVVRNAATQGSVDDVFGANDPQPGTFVPARMDADTIGANVDDWVARWADLYDAKRA